MSEAELLLQRARFCRAMARSTLLPSETDRLVILASELERQADILNARVAARS